MRVLHVNDVAGVASNLVRGLQKLGVESELFQPTVGTYRVSRYRRVLLPLIRTIEAFQLQRYVKSKHFDIVHIHYARFAYMALVTGLPYYLHVHGTDIREDMHKPGLHQLTLQALKSAERVFCATPDLVEKVLPYRSDVVFIPNPIDFKDFSPQPISIPSQKRILCISKLDRYKGMEEILETMEILWQQETNITFGMFNFGNNSTAYQAFLERNRDRLQLIERIPHEQMSNLINSFDIILGQQSKLASILTLSELEAMACGKPVVVNFQYAHSYRTPPPVLVSSTIDETLAQVRHLIHTPELRLKIGQDAQTWVMEHHNINLVAQYLLGYYQQ